MPYIADKKKRERINQSVEQLLIDTKTVGDLNYTITRLIHRKIETTKLCYDMLNSMIGVLACVQAELNRKVVGPYEEKKRIANGSVSNLDSKSLEDVR